MPEQESTETKKKRNSLRKRWIIRASAVFIIIGIIFFIYWLCIGRYHETTDDAYVAGNLVQVMSQISGRVTEILADETDLVKKGQPIIVLEKSDPTVALQNAESQLALTTRQVNQFYQNVDQFQASVKSAEDNLEKLKEDYQRRQGLVVNQTITQEDLRHAKLNYEGAIQALALAKHQLTSAVELVGNTDLYHHPQVVQAIVNVRNAYLNWARTTIRAPVTGYVAKRSVEVGQQITPDAVLMIITPLDEVWVNANYKESQLENIRIGQDVQLISDVYGNDVKYQGKVVGINSGAGDVFDLLPPQNATGNWIKIVQRLPVRIKINPDQLAKYPLRLGLSVTVTVYTRDRSGAMLEKVPQSKVIYQTRDDIQDLQDADQIINKILQENAKNIKYQAPPPTPSLSQ